eukprot:TRINITY_DN9641_c0_g1_i1.p1 TRINITY_DN9641_c0_g1~~TRINITY_DN9641_c0_g1_i1.p1  ORF type:complete len:529 (-),score=78.58 TRINITY_DN9641_c0_g1_i1:26-1612(-)
MNGRESTQLLPSAVRKEPSKSDVVIRSVCILGSEFCERLAFYSILANLQLFLTDTLHVGTGAANSIILGWTGTCYITPVIGGWLADAKLGRYKSILAFIIVYVIGMFLLALGALLSTETKNGATPFHVVIVVASLVVIAIGTGGIKSNVSTFGADQFLDAKNPQKAKQSFFNWFYFFINLGALFSFTVLAYIQEWNLGIGLAIPAGIMLISSIMFFSGTKRYIRLPPEGSAVWRSVRIVYHSIFASNEAKLNASQFLDRAKYARDSNGLTLFSAIQVEDVKALANILPIMLFFIVYWTLYSQMSSVFYTQGLYLDLRITESFSIPVAFLNLFDTVFILGLVPVFERVIYPALDSKGIKFGMLKRIGTGFIIIIFAMISAAFVEIYRLYLVNNGDTFIQTIGKAKYEAATLSVFVQIPQFALIGTSEVLTSITGLEFAYDQAPDSMKSTIMAILLVTTGLGNYLGGAIVIIVNIISSNIPGAETWIQNNINLGHLDYYFFLLALLGAINLLIYVVVSRRYQYRIEEKDE